jgi:hypothetical protein
VFFFGELFILVVLFRISLPIKSCYRPKDARKIRRQSEISIEERSKVARYLSSHSLAWLSSFSETTPSQSFSFSFFSKVPTTCGKMAQPLGEAFHWISPDATGKLSSVNDCADYIVSTTQGIEISSQGKEEEITYQWCFSRDCRMINNRDKKIACVVPALWSPTDKLTFLSHPATEENTTDLTYFQFCGYFATLRPDEGEANIGFYCAGSEGNRHKIRTICVPLSASQWNGRSIVMIVWICNQVDSSDYSSCIWLIRLNLLSLLNVCCTFCWLLFSLGVTGHNVD